MKKYIAFEIADENEETKEYKLDCTLNGLCEIQLEISDDLSSFEQILSNPLSNISKFRVLIRCLLKRHHPDLTLNEAGDIISSLGKNLNKILIEWHKELYSTFQEPDTEGDPEGK